VPFYTDFKKEDIRYDGEARVFLDESQRTSARTPLLPSIETMPPSNFHIGDVPPIPSNPTGWRFTPDGTFTNSCYLDEQLQNGSTRCLRFDNTIRNVGDGPLTLRFSFSPDAFIGHCMMDQEIVHPDASVVDRDAGPCIFHQQHAHFHYQNMGRYELYSLDAAGSPSAMPVAQSKKVGFCTIDVEDYTFGQSTPQRRPRTYSFPTCNIPNAASPTGGPFGPNLTEYMGISPGWGDIYTWDLPAQYIDISDTAKVPDGEYEVVSRSNPDGGILTADQSRQTGVTCIAIKGTSVAVLREFPSQSNSAPLPACAGAGAQALAATGATAARPPAAAITAPLTAGATGTPDTATSRPVAVAAPLAAVAVGAAAGARRRRRRRV
jgi:hypothetical protein